MEQTVAKESVATYHLKERSDPTTGRKRWQNEELDIPMQPTGQEFAELEIHHRYLICHNKKVRTAWIAMREAGWTLPLLLHLSHLLYLVMNVVWSPDTIAKE